MLKEVIQILLLTFILVLCYDTIDICLNQINSKTESELLIVKREIEETKQQVESSTPYETYDFPIWPIALGFSCAFCFVVCHFILPIKSISVKRATSRGSPHHKLKKNKRNYKKEKNEFSYFEEIDKKEESARCLDIRIKDKILYGSKDLSLISSRDLYPENDSKTDSVPQSNNKVPQENSYMNVCLPNFFHDEMFPDQSSLNVISNMGLSAPRSFYGEDSRTKHISKRFYEKNCEILTVNNAIFEENASQKSEDSNDSLSIKQGHIMGLLSVLNNDVSKPLLTTTSDKSINVQLLTYSDNDIKNIEKRLENIEYGLKKSEEMTKDWGNRINVAETELVDLHEQMYTIFSKFEEEKKTNYIIVSKVSKDKIIPKDRDIFDTIADEESDESGQVDEKVDDVISKNEIHEQTSSVPNPSVKDSSEEESDDEESVNNNKSNDEENQNSIDDSTEVILTELKQRSIALEALLDNKSRSQVSTYLPKKKNPQLSVPPHIIPPYKRSSFAGTDSREYPRKRRLNVKMPITGSEFFWRTKI